MKEKEKIKNKLVFMRTSNSSFFFMCSLCYNTNSVGDIMLYKGTMFRVEDIDYEEEELEYFTGIVRKKKKMGKILKI